MRVTVQGPRSGYINTDLTIYTNTAVRDICRQLGINRRNITVNVFLHHSSSIGDRVTEGECEPISRFHYNVHVSLYCNWLSVLAHELVHVKQFLLGELDFSLSKWKSRHYCGNLDYWDQPWEREARRLQGQLVAGMSC